MQSVAMTFFLNEEIAGYIALVLPTSCAPFANFASMPLRVMPLRAIFLGEMCFAQAIKVSLHH
jgi:hypothetical protein